MASLNNPIFSSRVPVILLYTHCIWNSYYRTAYVSSVRLFDTKSTNRELVRASEAELTSATFSIVTLNVFLHFLNACKSLNICKIIWILGWWPLETAETAESWSNVRAWFRGNVLFLREFSNLKSCSHLLMDNEMSYRGLWIFNTVLSLHFN